MPQFDIRYCIPGKFNREQKLTIIKAISSAVDSCREGMKLDSSGIDIDFFKRQYSGSGSNKISVYISGLFAYDFRSTDIVSEWSRIIWRNMAMELKKMGIRGKLEIIPNVSDPDKSFVGNI